MLTIETWLCRFFGGGGPFGGFGGFGGGFGEEEEQTPKGNNVYVELEVTLKDLFLGKTFTVSETLRSYMAVCIDLSGASPGNHPFACCQVDCPRIKVSASHAYHKS